MCFVCMVSPLMLSWTEVPSSFRGFGRFYALLLGVLLGFPLGFSHRPTTWPSGLTRNWGLHCVVSANPSWWSSELPWVEYAHNSLTNAFLGMTPEEVAMPSVWNHLRCCRRTWSRTRAALLLYAHPIGPGPMPTVAGLWLQLTPHGQKVWLSSWNIPLRVESVLSDV